MESFRRGAAVVVLAMALLGVGVSPCWSREAQGSLELKAGIREDRVAFTIAGDLQGGNPNILSELIWHDLEILQASLEGRRVAYPFRSDVGIDMRLSATYGIVTGGKNRDSDYAGDNRSIEYSRSDNGADGSVWDISFGAGPRIPLLDDRLHLTPAIGYAVSSQRLKMVDGFQTIDLIGGRIGPFPGLDSRYNTLWYGPWIGLEGEARLSKRVVVTGGVSWNFVTFEAEADWNLRTDFAHPKSFEHHARGDGVTWSVGAGYEPEERWMLRLEYLRRDWGADRNGIDRVFFSDGTVAETRLNEARWKSEVLSLGVTYRF